ncbi:hypothetical protein [Deinococcus wulumuqiensis]|nr:hypothetical protein [Deinococcus wulumuqiensis]QII22330.1 hypothetical protein G6R31_15865 [Deinococcus wulumuqiensis R12]
MSEAPVSPKNFSIRELRQVARNVPIIVRRYRQFHNSVADIELSGWYRFLDVPQEDPYFFSTSDLSDALRTRMLGAIQGELSVVPELRQLGDVLVYEEQLQGRSVEMELRLLETFLERCPSGYQMQPLSNVEAWKRAFEVAAEIIAFEAAWRPSGRLPAVGRSRYRRAEMQVRALQALGTPGLRVRDGQLLGEWRTAVHQGSDLARALIRKIGGALIIQRVFSLLERDDRSERYLTRRNAVLARDDGIPDIPWNHLLELASQAVSVTQLELAEPWDGRREKLWTRLLGVLRNLAAVYNVQFYNRFEGLLFHDLAGFARDVVLYDHLFTIPQWRPSDTPRLMTASFGWLPDSFQTNSGFSVRDAAVFAERLLEWQRQREGVPLVFSAETARQRCPELSDAALAALLDAASLPANRVNQGLHDPDSRPNSEHSFALRPLIEEGGRYLLFAAPWRAQAFFEVLESAARRWGETQQPRVNIRQKLGDAIEPFLREQLAAHGVRAVGGKAQDIPGDVECDAVVEAANLRVFIEAKSKVLTWAGRTGQDVYLLKDFANSGVYAAAQAVRNAAALIRHGHMRLVDADGHEAELVDQGDDVITLSLSLGEFGGLQTTAAFQEALVVMAEGGEFVAHRTLDDEERRALVEANQRSAQYRRAFEGLVKVDPTVVEERHGRRMFLSLAQFLVLLDGVSGAQQFANRLLELSAWAPISLDPYVPILMADGRRQPDLISTVLQAGDGQMFALKGPLETLGRRRLRPK